MDAAPAKIARVTPPPASDCDFSLVVEQGSSIRTFVDIVSSVLKQVQFTIVKQSDAQERVVLVVDTVDENHVCMVQGRLVCSGRVKEDGNADVGFCVDAKTFQNVLKSISKHHAVHIERKSGEADITLRTVDQMANKVGMYFKLSTMDTDAESLDMAELEYDHEADVDLVVLRTMFSMAKELGCERVNVAMMMEAGTTGTNTPRHMRISGKGTSAEFMRMIPRSGDQEMDDRSTVCMTRAQERMRVVTSASFTLEYLNKVIAKMDQPFLTVRMGDDLPMLMRYNMGEESFVNFVIAPKISD